jgi:hypothetical protein
MRSAVVATSLVAVALMPVTLWASFRSEPVPATTTIVYLPQPTSSLPSACFSNWGI